MADRKSADPDVIWKGRPSIGVFVGLYGLLALITIGVIDGLAIWASFRVPSLAPILRASLRFGSFSLPYAVEVAIAAVILFLFLIKVISLSIFQARHSYELRSDGLRVSRGLLNLEDDFVSAVAFSDARLIRTLEMRLVGRAKIIVEANDERRFEMDMIKDALRVQSLIRRTLSHPTVKIDKESLAEMRTASVAPATS